ncbi:MAG: hypothetical protein QI197_06060 [Candidatus Korarchaeota archaeon]|nr:hypothetical protein [Candidatus Korarchaeota archaeon]
MGLEYVLLASLEPEGFEIIAGYPSGFSEEMGLASLRSFPFSAKGGEVVKFSHSGFYFVGLTLRLEGERPRVGIASLLAVSKDPSDLDRLEDGLLYVHERFTGRKLTKDFLKGLLPELFRILEGYERGGSSKERSRSIVDRALERSKGLFFS